jgi:hypothetical protein
MGYEQRRGHMNKRLTFDATFEDERTRFEYLWDGIILGGTRSRCRSCGQELGVSDPKDRKALRAWAAIQKKLHTISEPDPSFDPLKRPVSARVLKPGTQEVVFEQGQIEEILARIEKVSWGGAQEIQVADVIDFLSAAPEVKDKE